MGERRSGRMAAWMDGAATSLSGLCLVHCIVLPIVIAAMPALGSVLHMPEWTHEVLLALALPLSLFALVRGYRNHGRWLPLIVGLVGLGLMALGVLLHQRHVLEVGLTVAGVSLVGIAHIGNWRLHRVAAHQPSPV